MIIKQITPTYSQKDKKWKIDFYQGGKRYQHSFKDKQKALRKCQSYQDSLGLGIQLDHSQMKDALNAENLLIDANFKDVSLTQVATWYIEHYTRINDSLTMSEAVTKFLKAKEVISGESSKTYKNTAQFLGDLKDKKPISDIKITKLTQTDLTSWLYSYSKSHDYRKRYLVEFFNYLCGTSKNISIETPLLNRNIAKNINLPTQKKTGKKNLIFTSDEVESLIKESIKQKCVTGFIWLLYTGMRPYGEFSRFWKEDLYGWNMIHFNESGASTNIDEKIIVDNYISKIDQHREIPITPELKEWLVLFKNDPKKYCFPPKNWKRKFSWVKETVLGKNEKYYEKDITRHTFISYSIPKHESYTSLTLITGNSEKIIRKNYASLVNLHDQNQKENYEKFWSFTPSCFDL